MNDPSTFGFEDGRPSGSVQPPPAAGGMHMGQYKFTPEELRVLTECNRESFYKRSLPLGTSMGFATFIGLQKGYFKPNARFGVLPKVTLAVIMGYFIGKLSYQEACAEKLMALPGSYIGQVLRDRKDKNFSNRTKPQQNSTMFGANSADIYSDAGPGTSLDLDTTRPLFNDDDYHPVDHEGNFESAPEDIKPAGPVLTYEELRRRNRSEHKEVKQDPYRMDPNSMPPMPRRPPPPKETSTTNKYGDTME